VVYRFDDIDVCIYNYCLISVDIKCSAHDVFLEDPSWHKVRSISKYWKAK